MQQSHSAISNQQYTFHYAERQPDTLVMLKPVNKMPQLIYQQIYTIKYIWIDNQGTFFDQDLYKKIEDQVGYALTRKSSFEQLKKDIQNSPTNNYHVLICQYRQDNFKHGSDQQITDKFNLRISQVYYITNDPSNQQESSKIFFDQNKLLQSIKRRAQKDSREKFGNGFLVITAQDQKQSPQIGYSTTLAKTFKAIFKQNIGQKVQKQLSQKIKQLFQQLERVNEYFKNRSGREQQQQFFIDIKQGLSNIQAIQWYTDNTQIYKTINKLMRAMRDSTQLFYLQPFVKPLYMAIKNKHENQWYKKGKFVCYRGGHISEFEFKRFKKGQIIQNLNFMSTSINQTVAEAFIRNAYFIIEVDEAEQQKQENQGFGFLQNETNCKGEAEILFNPLNSFQVVDEPKKSENYFQIKLRYGPLAKALVGSKKNNKQGKINREMPNLEGLAKHQTQKTSVIKIQGDTLIDIPGGSIEKGAENYWIKYEQIFNRAVKSTEKQNEQILLKKADLMNKIGFVYQFSSKFNQAEQYYKQAINIIQSKFGDKQQNAQSESKKHINIIKSQLILPNLFNNLGLLYQSKGDLAKALTYYEKCQKIQKQKLGENNIDYATTLNNLGALYQSKGDLDKALTYYKKCQKIQKQKFGEDNIDYARTLNNLALLYQSKGDLVKALTYYEKCQKIRKQKLGEDNLDYARTLNNLGALYESKGDFVKALTYIEKCQKIQKQKLGEDNLDYARTLNNLGALYESKGDFVKALTCYEKCQKIRKQKLGEDNIDYARTLNNLGSLYESKGDLEKALTCYEKCQNIQKQKLGEYNIDYATTLNNLGSLYESKGDLEKALTFYEKCQKIRKQKLGEDNITYANTAGNLSFLYLSKRDNVKCLLWLRKVQKIFNNLKKDGIYFNKQHQMLCLLLINLIENNKQNQLNTIINELKPKKCNTAQEEQGKSLLDTNILECCTQFLKLHHQIGLNLQRLLKSLPEQLKRSQFIKQELVEACRKMILELNAKQCFVQANEVYKFAQSLGFGLRLLKQKQKTSFFRKFQKRRLQDFLLTEMFISKSWRTQPKQKLEANSVKRVGKNCKANILMKCMQMYQLKRMGHYEEAQSILQDIICGIETGELSEQALELLWDELEEM